MKNLEQPNKLSKEFFAKSIYPNYCKIELPLKGKKKTRALWYPETPEEREKSKDKLPFNYEDKEFEDIDFSALQNLAMIAAKAYDIRLPLSKKLFEEGAEDKDILAKFRIINNKNLFIHKLLNNINKWLTLKPNNIVNTVGQISIGGKDNKRFYPVKYSNEGLVEEYTVQGKEVEIALRLKDFSVGVFYNNEFHVLLSNEQKPLPKYKVSKDFLNIKVEEPGYV